MKRLVLSLGLCVAFAGLPAMAEEEGLRLPPIDHAATLKECGACHLAFPPQMLPARSWEKIMAGLADHFGEDASLADDLRADIAAYLVANAADAPATRNGKRFLRGIGADATPLRLTETLFWQRAHDEISESRYASAPVKSRANCIACHKTADKGEFFEEEED